MPLQNGTYVPKSEEDILTDLEQELQTNFGADVDLTDSSVFTAIAETVAAVNHNNTEQSIKDVYDSAFLETATGEHLDKVVGNIGLKRTPAQHATGVVTFSRDTTADQDYVIQEGTTVQTKGDDPVQFTTTESVTLASGTKSVDANIRAVEGGPRGNVGANSIVVMPSPPTGVDSVTNSNPTGDPSYTDTNGDAYVPGESEEADAELRERAQETITKGGDATVDALISVLVNNDHGSLNEVESVTLYNNRTTNDNTGSGGLPPKSVELVVYGGGKQDIASAIFDKLGTTSRDVGGYHGSGVNATVEAVNGQQYTIDFSRPTEQTVDFTIDIVHDDTYDGDNDLRDRLVEYVGGTDSSGNSVIGTGVGEDVYIDDVEQAIKEDDGIQGISSITTTPSTTTDANGLTIVDIGANEVASTNGTDGSITINKTKV